MTSMFLPRPLRSALAVVACLASLVFPVSAFAQTADAQAQLKIAPDLMAAVSSSATPTVPWAMQLNGALLVKAVVVANSDDASLTDLRANVVAVGGSVYYNYASIRALAVMVPASRLLDLARRTDVASISP